MKLQSRLAAIVSAAGLATGGAVVAAPSASAVDVAPEVALDAGLHFLKGTVLTASDPATALVPMYARWRQHDPDGIASNDGYIHDGVNGNTYYWSGVRTRTPAFPLTANGAAEASVNAMDTIGNTGNDYRNYEARELQQNAATYSRGWWNGSR